MYFRRLGDIAGHAKLVCVSTLPPAGWYDDPEHTGYLRYWDGSIWTEHRSPVGGDTAAAAGPGGRLSDIGSWLSRTFNDLWARKVPLLALGAILLACWAVAGFIGTWAVDDLVYLDGEWDGVDGGRLGLASIGLLLVALASLIVYVAVVHQLYWARFGEDHSAGASLSAAIAVTPRVIGWGLVFMGAAIVVVVALLVVTLIVPVVGVLLILAMIPLGIYLWVKLAFFLVAIVAPAAEPNPFKGSARVSSHGRFWPVLGRLLLIGIISSVVGYVLSLPLGAASDPGSFDDIIVTDGSDEILYFHIGDFIDEIIGGTGIILLLSAIPQMLSSVIGVAGTTGMYAEVTGRADA